MLNLSSGPVRRQPQNQQNQQHQRQKSQSVHSPRDNDFLGQLKGRKSWWDAVAKKRLCQRDRGTTQAGVLGLTTSIPSSTANSSETEKGEKTDYLLIKGAMEPVRDEHSGLYSNLFLVKKQDGGSDLSST